MDIWYSSHNVEPILPGDILNESLWYNERILIGNKPVFNKIWFNAGVKYIKDIYNGNSFLSQQQFASKYNIPCETLFYNGIKTAIPRTWLDTLLTSNIDTDKLQDPERLTLKLINGPVDIQNVTCKQFYWSEIAITTQPPTSYFQWESYYYFADFDWELINKIPYDCTSETFLQSFQYKIIHRYFPCKYNLNVWKIESNNLCDHCNAIDTLSHYFAKCPRVELFWGYLKKWFLRNFEFVINFTPLDILLGIPNFDRNVDIDILNFVILYAKYFIYTCKKFNVSIDLYKFLVKLKTRIVIEEYRCKMYNKIQEFENKWSRLADIL